MLSPTRALAGFAALTLISCGAMGPLNDGGFEDEDAGMQPMDAGTSDAGVSDAGAADAGTMDAGSMDAGTPDAGGMDAGMMDAGQPDAGRPDAGELDAGMVDAGMADAGPPMICTPNSTITCYSGAAGTAGVGACRTGTRTCAADGLSYGACLGEQVPVAEVCSNNVDDNCNGSVNDGCPPAPPTYTADVRPIFQAKCGGCHTGGGSGGHNIGTSYADTQLASYYCSGSTKGACALVRIQDGTMPPGGNCASNPNGAACVTPAQQAIIQAWITGGQPQ